MPSETDKEYYVTGARQARELTDAATDTHIKNIHLDMAERYAKMQAESESSRPRLSMFKER